MSLLIALIIGAFVGWLGSKIAGRDESWKSSEGRMTMTGHKSTDIHRGYPIWKWRLWWTLCQNCHSFGNDTGQSYGFLRLHALDGGQHKEFDQQPERKNQQQVLKWLTIDNQ